MNLNIMNEKTIRLVGIYERESKRLGYEIKKNPPINLNLTFDCYIHNQKGKQSAPDLKKDLLLSYMLYKNNDLTSDNYIFFRSPLLYDDTIRMREKATYFTCICSNIRCKDMGFIEHSLTGNVFLLGSSCYVTLNPKLRELYNLTKTTFNKQEKRIKKEKEKLEKRIENEKIQIENEKIDREERIEKQRIENEKQEIKRKARDERYEKRRIEEKLEKQRLFVSRWTVRIGRKYYNKKYEDIDEGYAIYLLENGFFDNPTYEESNKKIIDYLCNKFNLEIS